MDDSAYELELETADRNRCIAYLLKDSGSFPEYISTGEDLKHVLELYTYCCHLTQNTVNMSVLAATLAAGGVNPLTRKRVFKRTTVRDCLSLMFSCGQYDDSGRMGQCSRAL